MHFFIVSQTIAFLNVIFLLVLTPLLKILLCIFQILAVVVPAIIDCQTLHIFSSSLSLKASALRQQISFMALI